jgi:multicomponent Na+:H+ antiporter subunit E
MRSLLDRPVVRWTARMTPPLALFWLVLSGHYTFLLLALGALSVALVCWVSWRAGFPEREAVALPLSPGLPRYAVWLAKEVLVSAVAVVRKVWSPRPAVRPVVETTPADDLSVLSQVVYANSITLTPGTLSLDVDADRIEVHGLDAGDVETLRAGRMLREVRKLEGQQ